MKQLLSLTLIIFIASCQQSLNAHRIGSSQEKAKALNLTPSSKDLAVVFIFRDNVPMNSDVNIMIGVGKLKISSLSNNSYTRIEMLPGTYEFKSSTDGLNFINDTPLKIKTSVVNIVRFMGSEFRLADTMLYGNAQLNSNLRDADYRVSYIPVYSPMNIHGKQLSTASTVQQLDKSAPVVPAVPVTPSRETQLSIQFAALQSKEKCKLNNKNWSYAGTNCFNGYAHGKGNAIDRQGLNFIGTFKNGQRVKGEIHQNGNMIFSGSLLDDKPDGNAICFFEDEYEECRFFKGKRIDTLYKIRKENAKIKAEMAQMQQAVPTSGTASGQKSAGEYATDAIKKEAVNRAASFIFDQFF